MIENPGTGDRFGPERVIGLVRNPHLAGQIAARQVLRYAGYVWDEESSLYSCSARSYDPATRQWTTGDPAKADGEASAYQYCGGDPVGGVDPSGRYRVNVDVVSQDRMKWCWAASAVCVIKAMTSKVVSRLAFVKRVKGKESPDGLKSSDWDRFRKAMGHYGVLAVLTPRSLNWRDVRHELMFKRPMICTRRSGDTSHMVVLFRQGWQGGERRVRFMDPGPYYPQKRDWTWRAFAGSGWVRTWRCYKK